MNLEEELQDYKSFLTLVKKLSRNSVEAYMSDINEFFVYLKDSDLNLNIENISHEIIEQYLIHISKDNNIIKSSQSRKISGIRSFFNYLMIYDKIEESPMDKIDTPKINRKIPETISSDELIRIFDRAKEHTNWVGLRNLAIIDTLYSTGIRVSELVGLKNNDIFAKDGFIRVVGKGDKERLVPINENTLQNIQNYRNSLGNISNNDTVFLNNRGKALTREMIFMLIKKLCREAGITRAISPHSFRHTFATDLVTAGVDIRLLQEILGHESIVTTEIYTHLDTSYKRQVIEANHPLNDKH